MEVAFKKRIILFEINLLIFQLELSTCIKFFTKFKKQF